MDEPFPELVKGLRAVIACIEQARALGLAVAIPVELVAGAREVVALREEERPGARAAHDAWGRALGERTARLFHLVPLRAAVLMVIKPGEEITSPVVVARLAELGMTAGNISVSNVLAHHLAQGTLERPGRGCYRLPVPSTVGALPRAARLVMERLQLWTRSTRFSPRSANRHRLPTVRAISS